MLTRHHIKKGTKLAIFGFVVSLIVLSVVGAYVGTRGRQVLPKEYPTQEYSEVTIESHTRDQLPMKAWFFPAGSNQVAVIVHGWAGNRARLLVMAEFLQRQNINVLTFDLRGGSGRNTYGQRESEDLAAAVEYVELIKKFEAKNVTVIGNSMGGAASIVYAASHDVGKLVLVSPVVDINLTKWNVLRERNYILPAVYAAGASLVERTIFNVRPINPKDVFGQINEPTLLIHGTADELSPIKGIYSLQDSLKGQRKTNTQFVIVSGAKHTFLDLDKHNNFVYTTRIADFIKAK